MAFKWALVFRSALWAQRAPDLDYFYFMAAYFTANKIATPWAFLVPSILNRLQLAVRHIYLWNWKLKSVFPPLLLTACVCVCSADLQRGKRKLNM